MSLAVRFDALAIMVKCADWLLSSDADAAALMTSLDTVLRFALVSSRLVRERGDLAAGRRRARSLLLPLIVKRRLHNSS